MHCSTAAPALVQFYAFDILSYRSRNILRLPLETRRELLAEALAKVEYPVLRSTAFDAKPADLIRAAKQLQLEGIIAKRKDSLYESGRRSGAWVKYKIQPLSRVCYRRLYARQFIDALSSDIMTAPS